MYQVKAKDSGMKSYPLFLSNVSKSFTINNLKETGSKENAKKIFVAYIPIYTNNILDIHRFLIEKKVL